MISKDTIALVRDRTDLVALVAESVPSLKQRGRYFLGLCPFHKEKTPSFNVNRETGVYHCFGCKESGDAITFLQRTEGYEFAEAVRALAERAGIRIETTEERGPEAIDADRRRKEREALYGAMNVAASWFEEQLRKHPMRPYAEGELARRDLKPDDPAAVAFRVGYAPPGWDGLAGFLKQQGISPDVASTVGLVVPRKSGTGYYDRFRHRLMFPVTDVRGRVVAFSGRALPPVPGDEPKDGEKPAKYVNSPETPIYVKGTHLFGLWQARNAIRQEERAVLVEGNFDVVSLHARGFANVVAPLGTAFTVDQARLLRRYAVDVTLLFDGDAAGRKAVGAAEEPCENEGLDAKVSRLPDGVDPDELVRSKGEAALRHILSQAQGLLEHLIDADLDEDFNAADSFEKLARVERIVKRIARQRDPVRREMLKAYADHVAMRLDVILRSGDGAFAALERKVRAAVPVRVRTGPRPSEARVQPRPPGSEERKAIAGALLEFPALLVDPEVQKVLPLLEGNSAQIVAAATRCLRTNERGEKVLDNAEFLAQMTPAIQAFASARLAAPAHHTIEEAGETVANASRRLRSVNVAQETGELVREQERVVGDWESELELAQQANARSRERLKGT